MKKSILFHTGFPLKQRIRQFVQKFGYDIVQYKPNQLGKYPLHDMKLYVSSEKPMIFDIGANIGQSVVEFRAQFPESIIHSFEPNKSAYEILVGQLSHLRNLYPWNLGLGSSNQDKMLLENSRSEMSSYLLLGGAGWGKVIKETKTKMTTVDSFCEEQQIENIDILKSDTQGYELEVFQGCERMMRANRIGLVYFEFTFSDMYRGLPSLSQVFDFLMDRDFSLVSFYQFFYQRNLASWTDMLFVNKTYFNEERYCI